MCEVTNVKSAPAWLETAKSGVEYTMRTRCPQWGRKHITVFRLRHVSDSFFVQLGHFFRYARHFDFQRLRWCSNSGQHPNWSRSKAAAVHRFGRVVITALLMPGRFAPMCNNVRHWPIADISSCSANVRLELT